MLKFTRQKTAPIPIEFEGKVYNFPRFTRADWDAFRADIDAARAADVGRGLTPRDLAQLLLLYPLQPLTREDAYRYVYTQGGAAHVFRKCAERATDANGDAMPEELIAELVDGGGLSDVDIEVAAVGLASIVDPDELARRMERDRQQREAMEKARKDAEAKARAALSGKRTEPAETEGDERFETNDPESFGKESAADAQDEELEDADPLPRTVAG